MRSPSLPFFILSVVYTSNFRNRFGNPRYQKKFTQIRLCIFTWKYFQDLIDYTVLYDTHSIFIVELVLIIYVSTYSKTITCIGFWIEYRRLRKFVETAFYFHHEQRQFSCNFLQSTAIRPDLRIPRTVPRFAVLAHWHISRIEHP